MNDPHSQNVRFGIELITDSTKVANLPHTLVTKLNFEMFELTLVRRGFQHPQEIYSIKLPFRTKSGKIKGDNTAGHTIFVTAQDLIGGV